MFNTRNSTLAAYEVCFMSQWEPYYILPKTAPLYDERFLNQGGDKQQHSILLNTEGYRFFVVRDHFIYHLDHFSSFKWPGGELKSGSLWDTFNIYEHFLPELEAKYGPAFRMPRCKVSPSLSPQLKKRYLVILLTLSRTPILSRARETNKSGLCTYLFD